MKAFCLIDFEDSFTYNIVSHFAQKDIPVTIYNWKKLSPNLIEKYDYFIFGPGPGHVDDYSISFNSIKSILSRKDKYSLGICLGHQIIFKCLGAGLVQWREPLHGRSLNITKPEWAEEGELTVQFYNSWGVDPGFKLDNISIHKMDDMVLAGKGDNFCSYQFHPESVGTTCPEIFLNPILKIYYNRKDGLSIQN